MGDWGSRVRFLPGIRMGTRWCLRPLNQTFRKGDVDDPRREATGTIANSRPALEALGSVLKRAGMGNGPRGLQPLWDRLGLLPARSRAFARLSLERRRHRRYLRPASEDLLRGCSVERPRPDSQRASLRAYRTRRQSRRGRQGALLLPRQHADPFLYALPLQVSAGGIPLSPAGR